MASVQMTVLGSCGAWPEANDACSGFLVDYDGFRLVLDLGFGTLPRLLAHVPDGAVDAVVITHEHSDHCVDLNGLSRVRYFDPNRDGLMPLYCTPGVVERVDQLEPDPDKLSDLFDIHELPGSYEVGPFQLEPFVLPHHVPNVAVRLSAPEVTVAYTGDTGPTPALAELGAGADLYIVEASHQGAPPDKRSRFHMTALDAGEWGARAGARRLMLTHFWPGSDREVSVAEASEHFDGEVIAAASGLTVEL